MRKGQAALAAAVLAAHLGTATPLASAQPIPPPGAAAAHTFSIQQLDALLAPVALYPDALLTQLLIAATFPLQVVEASRWLQDPAHASLKGQALTDALRPLPWDPSVKSLVAVPQVLAQLNGSLDWTQQLGFAMVQQRKEVLDAVQRLRRQAQAQDHLRSTPQHVVRSDPQPSGPPDIVIQPAQPGVVYVPWYSPGEVYGPWPYPSYPPAALPPPPGYMAADDAFVAGLAFGTGVAITAGLWGWASPNWGGGNVIVNVAEWNRVNVNGYQIRSNVWNAADGPVGRPVRATGIAPNAIGRASVAIPAAALDRCLHGTGFDRPEGWAAPRPAPGRGPDFSERRQAFQADRPGAAAATGDWRGFRDSHPYAPVSGFQGRRTDGAFSGLGEGSRAALFQQRGFESRQGGPWRPPGGRAGGFGGFRWRR